MLGIGPLLWRHLVEKHYPGRGLGDIPPLSREEVARRNTHSFIRAPASLAYYVAIDKMREANRFAQYVRTITPKQPPIPVDNLTNPS
jgi:hypothetical protein